MGGLTEYLISVEDEPFRWADHNCMTFTSGALVAQGFAPLPHDWCRAGDSALAAAKEYKRRLGIYGRDSIVDGMDDRYQREFTLHPQDGMICARPGGRVLGYAFGVVFRHRCIHVGEYGLEASQPHVEDIFWRPE